MNRRLFIVAFITVGFSAVLNGFVFASEEVSQGPRIEVLPQSWNFGQVKQGQIKKKIFTVKNTGNKDLIIESVFTSCGCTSAAISSYRIAGGEEGKLTVTYNAKGKSIGPDSKDVYIVSNDPLSPRMKITVRAEIVEEKTPHAEKGTVRAPTISSGQLYRRIKKGEDIVVLDVREKNEYIERHIPGAIWFPKSKFDKGKKDLEGILKKIGKNTTIVTYCGAGHRSSYVAKKLRQRGYNAFNLDGISFWERQAYPLVRGPKLAAGKEPLIIHLQEAYENYYKLFKDVIWVDVRNKQDYKKGHIKGALSLPLSEIEDKLYLIPKDKEVVLYCEGTWEGGKCDASMSAGRILIKNGFKQGKIKVFEDGYGAWEKAGYPVEKGDK